MVSIKAHFDGKVIVPEEPVNLPTNQPLVVQIQAVGDNDESVLHWLAENAVDSSASHPDLAQQHDHYLYGTPKRGDQS